MYLVTTLLIMLETKKQKNKVKRPRIDIAFFKKNNGVLGWAQRRWNDSLAERKLKYFPIVS